MTSTNEHLPSPPKPRMSPLEFRNTDLVSRLLAATPPYLYNMSLLPNTYFFSEMLRSFVQAKAERSGSFHPPIRRSRKRNWTTSRSECYVKPPTEQKPEETQQDNSADWMLKSNKKIEENPLELTINKPDNIEIFQNKTDTFNTKVETSTTNVYSNMHHSLSQDINSQNLVLPPPPPMWYPPLYPTPPYGIDPLHFFIDLRVSGHIYDKKNHKDHTEVSSNDSSSPADAEVSSNFKDIAEANLNSFKQTRNCSAFSVPIPSVSKSSNPINLCEKETKSIKFDVKSMGFDKSSANKTNTHYVMSNISNIYKNIHHYKEISVDDTKEKKEDTEEEKRVKDLRAVIGLELVVDYMKHKPVKSSQDESTTSTDIESVGSPNVEVVDEN